MYKNHTRLSASAIKSYLFIFLLFISACSENNNRTWSVYKADAASSSYSPLDQVNKENVHKLKVAWIFNPVDGGAEGTWFNRCECNPTVIDGIMYATSARHRLYAIDATNGKLVWSFDPFNGGKGGGLYRGVTYWEDGDDKRILFTAGDNL